MTTPTTVKINGSDGLLSAIPVLLSFHPVDSLVLACFLKGTNQLGPIVRVDLPITRAHTVATINDMVTKVSRHSDRCVVVFYGIVADTFGAADLIAGRGLPVIGVLFASNEPHQLDPAVHAEYVGLGHVVHATREDLRTQVEFNPDAGGTVDEDLIEAMCEVGTRDAWVAAHFAEAREYLEVLLATCRQLPNDRGGVANLCAVAAMFAYRTGNGTLAQVCVDRAWQIDPAHSLAHLMDDTLDLGVAPEVLDDVALALSDRTTEDQR